MKLSECKILIVEDDLISLEYLKEILISFGTKEVFDAYSAQEALSIAKEHHIDIVYMDINIHGATDGIRCASLLNKEYFLPIIFTTAYGDTATLNDAKDENMFGYLIKPFQPNDVEAATNVALKMLDNTKTIQDAIKPKEISTLVSLSKDYDYDTTTRTLYRCKNVVNLTKKELDILSIFTQHINHNVSYDYLRENVWQDKSISNSTIRDAVSRLKKKVPDLNIENISSLGYVMKV